MLETVILFVDLRPVAVSLLLFLSVFTFLILFLSFSISVCLSISLSVSVSLYNYLSLLPRSHPRTLSSPLLFIIGNLPPWAMRTWEKSFILVKVYMTYLSKSGPFSFLIVLSTPPSSLSISLYISLSLSCLLSPQNFIITAVVYHQKTTTMGKYTCALEKSFVWIRIYTTNWYLKFRQFLSETCSPIIRYLFLSLCMSFSLSLSLSLSLSISPALPSHQNFIISAVVNLRKTTTMSPARLKKVLFS